MKIKISKNPISLSDCPVGLFVLEHSKELCLKTEYGNNKGGLDCYIISSGEVLSCGGKTNTADGCDTIMVFPVNIN